MKEYKNEDIIVYWMPELCSHPGICVRALPEVFNPKRRPWVNINAAEPLEIIKAIDLCPSGALRYTLPEGSKVEAEHARGAGFLDPENTQSAAVTIKAISCGPLVVEGSTEVINERGKSLNKGTKMVLCGCGCSCNRPFCDGSHSKM